MRLKNIELSNSRPITAPNSPKFRVNMKLLSNINNYKVLANVNNANSIQ